MSSFVQYSTRTIRNREVLLAALKSLGIEVLASDVHEQPVKIRDYHKNTQKVHIVVRQNAGEYNYSTGRGARGVYSDWGFYRRPDDGTWVPVVDNLSTFTDNGQTEPIGTAIERAYGRLNADHAVRTVLTKTIPGLKARGIIPSNATVQRVPQGRTTRIVVSY